MSLIDTYESRLSNYSSHDADWVHFIRDNLQTIMDSSVWYEVDPFKLNSKKYRLEDFLRDEDISYDTAWIVLILNQLGSNMDFIGLKRIRIPSDTVLKQLRTQYTSLLSNFREARS